MFHPSRQSTLRSRLPLRTAVASVAGFALLASACSSGGKDDGGGAVQAGRASDQPAAAVVPASADVLPDPRLQLSADTVIVRSNGGRAVRSIPDDPDTLVIDAGAEGADQLDEGEIMLLTGVTVVRVAKLERAGDELRITGAPVALPEVIRDGELSWDAMPVDLGSARVSVWDDPADDEPTNGGTQPGGSRPGGARPGGGMIGGGLGRGGAPAAEVPAEGVPSDEEVEEIWGDVNDVFGGGDGGDLFGLGPKDLRLIASADDEKLERGVKVTVEGIEYSVSYTRDAKEKADVFKLGIESSKAKDAKAEGPDGKDATVAEGKVKGSIETEVQLKDATHSGKLKVVDGRVDNLEFAMPRLAGEINVDAKFQALEVVGHMTSDPLFDLPLSLEVPVVIGGVPFTLDVKVGVQVNLSLAKLNNTLNGLAKITFDGDAGFQFAGGQLKVFGERVQNTEDLLKALKGGAEGPVGLVLTNELPKLSFGLGFKHVKAGVFLSNGYVTSFHILPMPAPCTATNVSYVLASGVTGKFLGFEMEIARKAITEKQWHFQFPLDGRCNAEKP
ncbi:MAG TPA: hypothetical protein VFS16_19230 [Acidimicrobiia bacterium]|nr:hypothetical protein [Acidimicrobiia bacterium]